MTSLLNKTNRSFLSTRIVCFSLAFLLIGISAIAYAGKGTVVKKGVTPSLAAAKAIAIAQPLAFEVNQGQTDQSVKFLARAKGYDAFLTSNESIVRINGDAVLRTTLRNANQSPKIAGEDLQPGKSNYLLGNDRSKWIVGVSHFAKVRAKDVYPGIDALYSGNERQLEYDFVVSPGADPSQIRMSFDGARNVAVNSNGDLELHTASGMMVAHKPLVYQTIDGQRKPVTGDFVLLASNEAGFHLGQYDAAKTLVIDPTVTIAATVGGTADEQGFAVAANGTGIVLTGRTKSVNSAAPNNTPDKAASGFPVLNPISGFPGQNQHSTPPGSWDVFVTKFTIDPITAHAILAYSTFIGTPQDEAGTGVALDALGNAYVTGYTNSPLLFNQTNGAAGAFQGAAYNAFVVVIPPTGSSVTAASYLGGTGTTQAFAIALDPTTSNVVIGGLTSTPGLSVAPTGAQKAYGGGPTDGFIATLTPALALVSSTYLGGSGYEQVNGVAVGTDGAVYVTGFTSSGNTGAGTFPVGSQNGATPTAIVVGTVNAGTQVAFATKFNSATALSSRSYSSVFGAGGETANGIAVDPDGVAYVVGSTKSPMFSQSAQGLCGVFSVGGTLPIASISGNAIQWTAVCPTDPNQTQGFLVALTAPSAATGSAGGQVLHLALQNPITVHDAANVGGCNLNLDKNGGTLNGPVLGVTFCAGAYGSWNAVATDSDEQAYVTGQVGVGAQAGDVARYNRAGTVATAGVATIANDVNYGVAVNNLSRQEFVVGTTTANVAFGPLQGYQVNNSVPPPPTIFPAPDSIINNGGKDVSLVGIQWNDVFVTPSVVNFPAVGVGQAAPPAQTVNTADFAGNPVACTFSAPGAPFTIVAAPSTGQYTVTVSNANPGVFQAFSTFSCGAGFDNVTVLTLNEVVSGPLTTAPSATLTSTSVIGSGILAPYNTVQGNATITVQVTTPAGAIPYNVNQTNRSVNWPNCGLITTPGNPAGTATPPPGSAFNFTINSACAAQLALGTYTENIAVSSVTGGLASTVNLPFSLTITNGGVIGQYITDFFFGASLVPQVSNFTVQAPAGALTYALVFQPPIEAITPLPAANAAILQGARGPVPATGSVAATVQINPTGLAAGVYGFCYFVSSPQIPQNNGTNTTCARVYVGTGLGFISPAGGTLNISVPVGFTPGNITQPISNGNFPPQINVTGLANIAASPYSVTLPSGAAISAFTPALPAGAFTLTANDGSPCSTNAEAAINNPTRGPSCRYTVTIDATLLAVGTYTGTVTFTGATGVTAVLTVNLTATQYPILSWINQQGIPMASYTVNGVAGTNTTYCTNNPAIPFPLIPSVMATGGVVPAVTATLTELTSPAIPWLGIGANGINGITGTPGSLGNTAQGVALPNVNGFANPISAPNFYNTNICVTAATITKPGTYTGTVVVSGGGVQNVPATLQVNFIVSGTGVSNVGIFRGTPTPEFYWLLDANGNTLFDGVGPGLDIATAFGGLAGDIAITGDWSGTGTTKIGVYRSATGQFLLDYNDNGTFDGALLDRVYQFMPAPVAGDIPVAGDWTGTGTSKIGIYRPSTGQWFLDTNGNGVFDAGDVVTNYGGLAGDIPVTGDWTGSGTTKIGLFRAGFFWILDTNGNGTFDAGDAAFAYGSPTGGITGGTADVPVVGDWNGTGTAKVGVFRLGFFWVLDTNGDHVFTAGEQAFPFGGLAGDIPVVGKWRKP